MSLPPVRVPVKPKNQQCCGSSEPMLWLVKGDDGIESFQKTGDINEVRMSCDCKCPECKALYNSYLEETSYLRVMQQTVNEYKQEQMDTIALVTEMEQAQREEKKEMAGEYAALEVRLAFVERQLEHERGIRMADVYRLEFAQQDNSAFAEDASDLHRQLNVAVAKLPLLQRQNELLREGTERQQETVRALAEQLGRCEGEVRALDETNSWLRLRLNEADGQVEKNRLRLSNSTLGGGGGGGGGLGGGGSVSSFATGSMLLSRDSSYSAKTGMGPGVGRQRGQGQGQGQSAGYHSAGGLNNAGSQGGLASAGRSTLGIRRFTPQQPSLLVDYCKKYQLNLPRKDFK
ncbi:hypothetical protein B484DRAFT_402186 [Ochromonadaceae sp. CCMP2298]|nr:hypothetical protein B484DRAFT_402186 [Ochromonadaceae sp. CCMP2298]